MSQNLKPCPLCSSRELAQRTVSEDERSGYNYAHIISCACGIQLYTRSTQDKLGWCNESRDSVIERAVSKWNRRPGDLAEAIQDAQAQAAEDDALRAKP